MTTSDRELLALAAKAAGKSRAEWDYDWLQANGHEVARDLLWDPRRDSGQALELAVMLWIVVSPVDQSTIYPEQKAFTAAYRFKGPERADQFHDGDPFAATRLAITRAAAAIGATMP